MMEIEIITTKKKLTKSIVNQMRHAPLVALKFGEPIGFLIGVNHFAYKVILIRYGGNYFIIPANYKKGDVSVYRKVGKWSQAKRFETPELCDDWWKAYSAVLKAAVNQIYI